MSYELLLDAMVGLSLTLIRVYKKNLLVCSLQGPRRPQKVSGVVLNKLKLYTSIYFVRLQTRDYSYNSRIRI